MSVAVVHDVVVVVREQRDGDAVLARAARAPDAVRVRLDLGRQVVVDYVRDVRDVESAASDVGRHEHVAVAVSEALEALFALVLRLAAVQHRDPEARGCEHLGDHVALFLDVDKDDDLRAVRGLLLARLGLVAQDSAEKLDELGLLLAGVQEDHALVDALVLARVLVANLDDRWVAQERLREPLDLDRHRRAKHGRDAEAVLLAGDRERDLLLHLLLVLRLEQRAHVLEHRDDLRLKAHVDHAVGLVEHDVVALVEHEVVALEAVHEPPGRADHHIDALAQLERLVLDALAADDRQRLDPVRGLRVRAPDARVLAELDRLLLDLERELAGRRHHERERALLGRAAHVRGRQRVDIRDDRDHERRGLARAGLSDADDVAALEPDRDRLHLDRRRARKAHVRDRVKHGLWQRGRGLGPRAQRVRRAPALDRDVKVLAKDAPVALAHVGERLLGPVRAHGLRLAARERLHRVLRAVLHAAQCALAGPLALGELRLRQRAVLLVRGAVLTLPLLRELGQKRVVLALLAHVDACAVAAPVEQVHIQALRVERVQVRGRVLGGLPVKLEDLGKLLARLHCFLLGRLLTQVLVLDRLHLALVHRDGDARARPSAAAPWSGTRLSRRRRRCSQPHPRWRRQRRQFRVYAKKPPRVAAAPRAPPPAARCAPRAPPPRGPRRRRGPPRQLRGLAAGRSSASGCEIARASSGAPSVWVAIVKKLGVKEKKRIRFFEKWNEPKELLGTLTHFQTRETSRDARIELEGSLSGSGRFRSWWWWGTLNRLLVSLCQIHVAAEAPETVQRRDAVRLRERRVVEHRVPKVRDRAAHGDRDLPDVDDLCRAFADRVHAKELERRRVKEDLEHAARRAAAHLPFRELRVLGNADLKVHALFRELLLRLADHRDLWDRIDAVRVVAALELARQQLALLLLVPHVARCEAALLHARRRQRRRADAVAHRVASHRTSTRR
ncbi:hypothetical protein PybrP1_011176 [[Pythium] brassicae (nom. inval.)]|nr:hypothetical protein PybrP1_011176 [[Pythium] brassicae (nom. inval.)]